MSNEIEERFLGYWALLYSHGQSQLHVETLKDYLKRTKRDLRRAEGPQYLLILLMEDQTKVYKVFNDISKESTKKVNIDKPFSYSVRQVMDKLDFLGNKRSNPVE